MHVLYRLFLPLLVLGFVLVGCDDDSVGANQLGNNTTVGFAETSAAVDEASGSFTAEIVANDPGFKRFTFDVTVDQAQSTATLEEDVRGLPADTTLAFEEAATSGQTLPFSFEIVDEPVDSTGFLEDPEDLVLTLTATDTSGTAVGSESTLTLTIEEDDESLTTQEARDRPTGGRAVVDGIVTRVESDGAYVQDGEGALFVFDSDFASQASRGDSVRVDGSTTFFSGLFQIEGASSGALTEVFSSGNPLPAPQTVTLTDIVSNGEEFESELIRAENFAIDDGGDQTFQGGTNYTITDDTTSTLRIPGGSELEGEDIPERANFQGVLGQFNNFGDPDDNTGYQLLGLKTEDLEAVQTPVSVDFDDDTLPPMTAVSVASNEDWGTSDAGGAPNAPVAAANGFGGSEPANDWLITPAINFNDLEGETLQFLNAKGFDDSGRRGLQVKVSTDYDGSGSPENFTWTDVSDRVTFSSGNDTFVNSGRVDLSDFEGQEVYIAFQYRSSGTGPGGAARWQVDDIVVSGFPAN
jgi:hypothetical protein